MLSLDNIYKARYVLGRTIRKTEVVRAPKLNACVLRIVCETRNDAHVAEINNALRDRGFKFV